MSAHHLSRHLFEQISSAVEGSFHEEASHHATVPHNEVVIIPSTLPRRYSNETTSIRRSSGRIPSRSPSNSPHLGKSQQSSPYTTRIPISGCKNSDENVMRPHNALLKDEVVLVSDGQNRHENSCEERNCAKWISLAVIYTMIFFNGCCFTGENVARSIKTINHIAECDNTVLTNQNTLSSKSCRPICSILLAATWRPALLSRVGCLFLQPWAK